MAGRFFLPGLTNQPIALGTGPSLLGFLSQALGLLREMFFKGNGLDETTTTVGHCATPDR